MFDLSVLSSNSKIFIGGTSAASGGVCDQCPVWDLSPVLKEQRSLHFVRRYDALTLVRDVDVVVRDNHGLFFPS
jgi:hypothetical protein